MEAKHSKKDNNQISSSVDLYGLYGGYLRCSDLYFEGNERVMTGSFHVRRSWSSVEVTGVLLSSLPCILIFLCLYYFIDQHGCLYGAMFHGQLCKYILIHPFLLRRVGSIFAFQLPHSVIIIAMLDSYVLL